MTANPGRDPAALVIDLAPEVGAPARARSTAARAFRRWGVHPAVIRSAELVISELVTNAVRHAGTPAQLQLRLYSGHLRLAVRDGSAALPRPTRLPVGLAETGRGLHIVGQLASSWGAAPTGDGKVVWATLQLSGESVAAGPHMVLEWCRGGEK